MGGADTEIDDATTDVLLEMAWFQPIVDRQDRRAGWGCAPRRRPASRRAPTPRSSSWPHGRFAELLAPARAPGSRPGTVDVRGELPDRGAGPRAHRPGQPAARHRARPRRRSRELLEPIGFARHAVGRRTPTSTDPVVALRLDRPRSTSSRRSPATTATAASAPTRAAVGRTPAASTAAPAASAARLRRAAGRASGCAEAHAAAVPGPRRPRAVPACPATASTITNPLVAEESVLRTSLLPGLLKALAYNAARRNTGVGLFEIGHVFRRPPRRTPSRCPTSASMLGVALGGARRAAAPCASGGRWPSCSAVRAASVVNGAVARPAPDPVGAAGRAPTGDGRRRGRRGRPRGARAPTASPSGSAGSRSTSARAGRPAARPARVPARSALPVERHRPRLRGRRRGAGRRRRGDHRARRRATLLAALRAVRRLPRPGHRRRPPQPGLPAAPPGPRPHPHRRRGGRGAARAASPRSRGRCRRRCAADDRRSPQPARSARAPTGTTARVQDSASWPTLAGATRASWRPGRGRCRAPASGAERQRTAKRRRRVRTGRPRRGLAAPRPRAGARRTAGCGGPRRARRSTSTGCEGGFLGVDLFFALSGYLITSLLVVERRTRGGIALGAFWVRRARRLLPALLVLAGRGGGPVDDAHATPAIARTTAATRWPRWATSPTGSAWRPRCSYWDIFRQPSPLDHTWSLAIEEQFYLVWPLVALVVLGGWRPATGGRRPRARPRPAGSLRRRATAPIVRRAPARPARAGRWGRVARRARPCCGRRSTPNRAVLRHRRPPRARRCSARRWRPCVGAGAPGRSPTAVGRAGRGARRVALAGMAVAFLVIDGQGAAVLPGRAGRRSPWRDAGRDRGRHGRAARAGGARPLSWRPLRGARRHQLRRVPVALAGDRVPHARAPGRAPASSPRRCAWWSRWRWRSVSYRLVERPIRRGALPGRTVAGGRGRRRSPSCSWPWSVTTGGRRPADGPVPAAVRGWRGRGNRRFQFVPRRGRPRAPRACCWWGTAVRIFLGPELAAEAERTGDQFAIGMSSALDCPSGRCSARRSGTPVTASSTASPCPDEPAASAGTAWRGPAARPTWSCTTSPTPAAWPSSGSTARGVSDCDAGLRRCRLEARDRPRRRRRSPRPGATVVLRHEPRRGRLHGRPPSAETARAANETYRPGGRDPPRAP